MNVFEKIREKLEEKRYEYKKLYAYYLNGEDLRISDEYNNAISIVNQVEEEYNNGWIPVEERLPDNLETVIFTTEDGLIDAGWYDAEKNWCVNESYFPNAFRFIAWQPLPKPYEPEGE